MERSVVSRKPWNLRARSLFAKLGIVAVLAGVAVPLVSPAPASAMKRVQWCEMLYANAEFAAWNEDWVGYAYWRNQILFTGCY